MVFYNIYNVYNLFKPIPQTFENLLRTNPGSYLETSRFAKRFLKIFKAQPVKKVAEEYSWSVFSRLFNIFLETSQTLFETSRTL